MVKTAKKYEVKFGEAVPTMGPHDSEVDLNKPERYKEDKKEQKRIIEENKKGLKEIIEKAGGSVACEVKEDGYRCQSHVDGKRIKLFSRSATEFDTNCYPDVIEILDSLKLKETVLDGEMKGLDKGLSGFNTMEKRVRYSGWNYKDPFDPQNVKQHPLEIVFFDVLMLNGKSCLDIKYIERRQIVEELVARSPFAKPSEQNILFTPEGIMELYNDKVNKDKAEGLVVKQPNLIYIPGDKKNWIKLKKFEPLDLVVIGLYNKESDKYETNYRKALVASYNPETNKYESIGTVSVIVKNEATKRKFGNDIEDLVKKGMVETPPKNVVLGKNKSKHPDVYVVPEKSAVLEVVFMNIELCTNGNFTSNYDGKAFYLRMPVIERLRTDKTPQQASTPEQVAKMYEKRK